MNIGEEQEVLDVQPLYIPGEDPEPEPETTPAEAPQEEPVKVGK